MISPLVSLMVDQVCSLQAHGARMAFVLPFLIVETRG